MVRFMAGLRALADGFLFLLTDILDVEVAPAPLLLKLPLLITVDSMARLSGSEPLVITCLSFSASVD